MFVRTATRRNKDGTGVRYLQLVHNEWDPAARPRRCEVLHSFGRDDQLDRAAIARLVASLSRLLDPAGRAALRPPGLAFIASRPFGGAVVLDGLWRRLGIDADPDRPAAASAAATRRPSGCCSRWSPTGRWSPPPSWPRPTG